MSAKSEAAELAAKAVAKGALNLISWGKKIIPATADEIEKFGPNAARVKGLLNMVENTSEDAAKLVDKVPNLSQLSQWDALIRAKDAAFGSGRKRLQDRAAAAVDLRARMAPNIKDRSVSNRLADAGINASRAEVVSDLITPEFYLPLTNPLAVARRFDMTVPNAPESFTNIARSLGERSLLATPKDIELARRVSMLPPAMQQVYLDLVGEGTDPAQLLQALRLMGQ